MAEIFSIPIIYREGNYGLKDFTEDFEDSIDFDYDSQYQILEYDVPIGEDNRSVRLYQIPERELLETVNASYDKAGHLQKITAHLNRLHDKESLLYIRYEDVEDAKRKIKDFAIRDADDIADRICAYTDVVARLFVEYFWDGEALDFHALLGTPEQKEALEKKYPNSDTIADSPGDYPSDFIYGDNETLSVMLYCADSDEFCFVQYAFDTMSERMRDRTVDRLNKSDDFKFISMEYD